MGAQECSHVARQYTIRFVQLLVSVSDEEDAAAAEAGGADVIDAKDPTRGALGPVTADAFVRICRTVNAPISAALGDAANEDDLEQDARAFHGAGATFVKVGFAGTTSAARMRSLLSAAHRGAPNAVVAVAYADAVHAGSAPPDAIFEAAIEAGATGVLLDTADKSGPGLRALMPARALERWVATARGAGIRVALAGQLTKDDLTFVRDLGADIAGVRGAACVGGRTGRVCPQLVRALRATCA